MRSQANSPAAHRQYGVSADISKFKLNHINEHVFINYNAILRLNKLTLFPFSPSKYSRQTTNWLMPKNANTSTELQHPISTPNSRNN